MNLYSAGCPDLMAQLKFEGHFWRSAVKKDEGETNALQSDTGALMVLRHYGVTTRLLDWSQSPFVAAYFAVCEPDTKDGDIWSFDHDRYVKKGGEQWARWPRTTVDGNGINFVLDLTAFTVDEPDDWFVCQFYNLGFPRQKAQSGLFTLTARFGQPCGLDRKSFSRKHLLPSIPDSRSSQAWTEEDPPRQTWYLARFDVSRLCGSC